jgi:endonuclease/exonuclease/phosphatase family metal-dependent hydrolase
MRWRARTRIAAAMQVVLLLALGVVGACARATIPDATSAAVAGRADAAAVRVMTFNIRYDNPDDGVDAWPNRRDRVAGLIRFHGADAVGVQEAEAHQLVELDARLPGFARVGVGRTDGREEGEFSAILYRTARLDMLASGTFWLSPTPEVVGSKGWDAAIERVATWARFRDRATGCTYVHLNTHFDHMGERAREESARLVRQRLATLAAGLPVVVTGDLNVAPTTAAYRIFTRDTIAGAFAPLADAFATTRTPHYGPTATWTAFKAIEPGQRIDYVLVSPGVAVHAHGILSDRWDDRFPSDHLPVLAVVEPCAR